MSLYLACEDKSADDVNPFIPNGLFTLNLRSGPFPIIGVSGKFYYYLVFLVFFSEIPEFNAV